MSKITTTQCHMENIAKMPDDSRAAITIAKGTSFALAGAVIGKGSEYLTKVLLGRTLGPENFGIFNLVLGALFFLGSLSILDLTATLIRFTSVYSLKGQYHKIKRLVSTTLGFSTVVSIILLFVAEYFSKEISTNIFKKENIAFYLSLMVIGLPFFVFNQYFFNFLISIKEFKKLVLFREFINKVLRLLLILFLMLIGLNLERVLLVYICIFGLITTFGIIFLRRFFISTLQQSPIENVHEESRVYNEIFRFSWPLSLSALFAATMSKMDVFSVGYFLGMEDLGLYSAAYTLAMLIYFPAQNFNEMLIPTASQLFSNNNLDRLSAVYKTNTNWLFYIMFPFFALAVFKPDAVIILTFGRDYLPAAFALRILLFGILFQLFGTTWSAIIHATAKTKIVFPLTIINFVLLFALYIFLIPHFGFIGAAWSFTIATIILYVPKFGYIWHKFRLTPFSGRLFVYMGIVVAVYICEAVVEKYLTISLFMSFVFGVFCLPIGMIIIVRFLGLSRDDITVIEAIELKWKIRLPISVKKWSET